MVWNEKSTLLYPAVCSSRAVRQRVKCPKVKSRGNFFHANGQQLLSSRHSPLLLTVHSLPSIIGSLEFTKTWQQNWNLIKISKKSVVFVALMLQHALLFCQSSAALTVGKLTIQEITNAKCGMFGFLARVGEMMIRGGERERRAKRHMQKRTRVGKVKIN